MTVFITAVCPSPFRGKTLTVSFVGNPPYVTPAATGVDIVYADTVGDMLGFKRKFFLETNRGTFLPQEKRWIGLLANVGID